MSETIQKKIQHNANALWYEVADAQALVYELEKSIESGVLENPAEALPTLRRIRDKLNEIST